MSIESVVLSLLCWLFWEIVRRGAMALWRQAFPTDETLALVEARRRAAREDKAVERSFFRWERERQQGLTSPVTRRSK